MKLQQLRSTVADKQPQGEDLANGQLALNINADTPAIYFKDTAGVVRKVAGAGAVGNTTVNGREGDVTLSAEDVGLENADNTADADKPVSTATKAALDEKADLVDGKVPSSQIPAIAISLFLGTVEDQDAMLALEGDSGDWCNRADTNTTFVLNKTGGADLTDWTQISYPTSAVVSVNEYTGAVVLEAKDVGALAPNAEISLLNNDVGYLTAADLPEDNVTSVNTLTGNVVLTTAEISDATSAKKYVSVAQIESIASATQPGDPVSDLNNDLGYLTAETSLVKSVNDMVGIVSLGMNNLTDVTVSNMEVGDLLSWDGSKWVSVDMIDSGSY